MAKTPCPVDLLALRNLVGLCAFAAEARRVLEDVDHVCNVMPKVAEALSSLVPARNQWGELPFPLSDVLGDVWSQIKTLDDWKSAEEVAA